MRELTRPSVQALAAERWDIVVVGAGAHGAFAAWDAALRGLRVLLVERDDFGGATSANSLKLVHGGLRYLQAMDIRRLRRSVYERAVLLRIAPHLVVPQACLLPTRGSGTHSRAALATALALDAVLARTRDHTADPARRLPRGRVVSAAEYRRMAGPLAVAGATGAALWHDGVMLSSERLLLAVVRAAAAAGAVVRNHTEVTALRRAGGRVDGVQVRDDDGAEVAIAARVVLNAAGPWAGALLATGAPALPPSVLGWNLVVGREGAEAAAAIPSARERRMLFAVPWQGALMIGTGYRHVADAPRCGVRAEEHDVRALLADVNEALPGLALERDEVALVHAGVLPADGTAVLPTPSGRAVVRDHAAERPSLPGLVTVQGVKWTTARHVAERAVSLCERAMGREPRAGGTDRHPVFGGDVTSVAALAAERSAGRVVDDDGLARLKTAYGTAYTDVLALAATQPALARPLAPGAVVIGAQVLYAVRAEQACTLADVALRRTALGSTGHPDAAAVDAAARLMAIELGWSDERVAAEIAAVGVARPATLAP